MGIWQGLTRGADAAVLFGCGFGELVKPESAEGLCSSWATVPTGMDYLAVCASDTKRIMREHGNKLTNPWQLIDDLYWYTPDNKPCQCSSRNGPFEGKCELAHVLLPKFVDNNPDPASNNLEDLSNGGAVIFGYNSKYSPYLQEVYKNKSFAPKIHSRLLIRVDSGYGSPSPEKSGGLSTRTTSQDRSIRPNIPNLAVSEVVRNEAPMPTLQSSDRQPPGRAHLLASHTAADNVANNTIDQPIPAPYKFYRLIQAVIALIAIHLDLNFYWKTVSTSSLITYLYYHYIIPLGRISPDQRRSQNTWNFLATSIVFIATRIGMFLLLAWLFVLSPAHVITYSPIDVWTEYLDHPPHEPSINVYDPGKTSTVDVFAIHGLGSNPSSAWRYRENGTNIYWLDDILPKQAGLEQIRVTALSHQTRWDSHVPNVGPDGHARKMLSEIKLINQGERPIIFIAHSFGGLLLKQALLLDNKDSKQITSKTKGILFLGVSHFGTKSTFPASLLSCTAYWRGSSTTLLEYMSKGNPSLKTLDKDFYDVFVRPKVDIPYIGNFVEMRPEKISVWSLGPTVSYESAEIYYAENEILDTDHRGLNKFRSPTDPNFRSFFNHFNCAMARATNESTCDIN